MIGVGINTSSVGGQPKPRIPGAPLVANFIDGSFPGSTFTRASNAWNFASNGVTLVPVAGSDILRRDLRSALIEAGATAHACNSNLSGFVAGSPGTLPTNWNIRSGLGLTRTISTTTIDGVSYLDITFSGVTVGTNGLQIQYGGTENTTGFAVVQNDPINTAISAQVLVDHAAVTTLTFASWCFAGATYVGADSGGGTSFYATRSTLGRYNHQRTVTNATVTNAITVLLTNTIAAGTSINFTIRLGLPQMTKTTAVTSPIITGTSAVTRAAETLTCAVAGIASGGDWTLAGVATMPTTPDNSSENLIGLGIDANNRWVLRRDGVGGLVLINLAGGANTGSISRTAAAAGARSAWAARRSGSNIALSINGGAVATAAPSSMPAGAPILLAVGQNTIGSGQWNSFSERALVFGSAANDATLQSYSTLSTWGG